MHQSKQNAPRRRLTAAVVPGAVHPAATADRLIRGRVGTSLHEHERSEKTLIPSLCNFSFAFFLCVMLCTMIETGLRTC